MKILHLNTYAGNGGAGKACLRLHKALKDHGVDSNVAVNFLFRSNPEVHNFSRRMISKYYAAMGMVLERFIGKVYTKSVPIPFSIPIWGRDISEKEIVRSADVIHIHWINHAFLGPAHLAELAKLNKPIVWTFHDSNAFTGGCHVRYSCDHYQNECGNCPVLKDPDPDDMSHTVWLQKEKCYQQLRFSIIAPSVWMAESVKKSKLLGLRPVYNLPNTLDLQVFRPYSKEEARERLGIPKDKFIMLSGFMPSRRALHKGTEYLQEAIAILKDRHGFNDQNSGLVIFGTRDPRKVPEFPLKSLLLGTVSSEEKLALCYSAADVFLAPSLEDNLPNTVMESLACGTPVVAFTTGGIPDMVEHQLNGYLAAYRSSEDLAAGINWIHNHPDRGVLAGRARSSVEEKFSPELIAKKHADLYRQLVNEHDGSQA